MVSHSFRSSIRAWIGAPFDKRRSRYSSDTSALRARCLRYLEELDLPSTFDRQTVCDRVAATRGRALKLQALPQLGATAPCGLWIAAADTDYVFYEAGTSPLHADHIILHELCHMVCGHAGILDGGRSQIMRLMPHLDASMVHAVLGRVTYSTAEEREAELLASLIHESGLDSSATTAKGGSSLLAKRVEAALNPTFGSHSR